MAELYSRDRRYSDLTKAPLSSYIKIAVHPLHWLLGIPVCFANLSREINQSAFTGTGETPVCRNRNVTLNAILNVKALHQTGYNAIYSLAALHLNDMTMVCGLSFLLCCHLYIHTSFFWCASTSHQRYE